MLLQSLLFASTLALQSSGFLIPPESAQEAGIAQIRNHLKHQTLELDCPGCPFVDVDGDGSLNIEEKISNTIHLKFDVSDDEKFLQINGQPVYPPPKTLIPISLKAEQVRTSDSHHGQPLRLGYAVEILPTKAQVSDVSLTPIQLTIVDLQGIPVKVDTVRIDLIHSWGKLHIAQLTRIPFSQSPGAEGCTTSLCRIRAIISTRIRKMMEEAKARAGKAASWVKNTCKGRRPQSAHVAVQTPDDHAGFERFARVRAILRRIVKYVLLPGLAGFLGGYLISIVVLAISHAVYRRFAGRRSSNGTSTRSLNEVLQDEEKDGLMENGELPPQYEDVKVAVLVEHK